MAFKSPIPGGAKYEVSYDAGLASGGASLLVAFWIPRLPATVPDPQETTIAPGMSGALQGIVPAKTEARRLVIRVDLPDGTGRGTLTLKVNGQVHSRDELTKDTEWTSAVHP